MYLCLIAVGQFIIGSLATYYGRRHIIISAAFLYFIGLYFQHYLHRSQRLNISANLLYITIKKKYFYQELFK
ncbi:MFS transporter (plasmid) [Legionella sp. D16C41]|uniref:MFS transporter n=1 Tax=Legionella sp. D16C41 TaxID=3402688 RepID=UPI003AF6E3E4